MIFVKWIILLCRSVWQLGGLLRLGSILDLCRGDRVHCVVRLMHIRAPREQHLPQLVPLCNAECTVHSARDAYHTLRLVHSSAHQTRL